MRNINYVILAFVVILFGSNYIYNNYYNRQIIEGYAHSAQTRNNPIYIFFMLALLIYLLLTKESPTLKSMGAYN